MKKIINLIRKDYLLDKKNTVILFMFAVIIPIYLSYQLEMKDGSLPYFVSTLFIVYLIQNSVSLVEFKYKGSAYLCTTPYMRKYLVFGKYAFVFSNFLICTIMYGLTALSGLTVIIVFSLKAVVITFGVITLLFDVYIPLEYMLGYDKVKYVFYVLVIATPWTMGVVYKIFPNIQNIFAGFLANRYLYIVIVVFSILVTVISVLLSVHIFERKDL